MNKFKIGDIITNGEYYALILKIENSYYTVYWLNYGFKRVNQYSEGNLESYNYLNKKLDTIFLDPDRIK